MAIIACGAVEYIDSCVPCPSFAEDKKRVQKSQCNKIPAKCQTLAKKSEASTRI